MGRRHCKNKELLDNQIFVKIHRLFNIYKEIPLTHIPLIYKKHYDEVFDAMPWGYTWGLMELFDKEMKGMVEILYYENGVPVYTLRQTETPKVDLGLTKNKRVLNKIKERSWIFMMQQLLDPELPIWANFKELLELDQSSIRIDLSPFEILHLKDERQTREHVKRFHQVLSNNPQGIRLDEMFKLFENLNKSFELFGSPDVCSLTQEYFEIFHVRQEKNSAWQRVYDGSTITNPDLDEGVKDSQAISAKSIAQGLYQKTLLLLSITAGHGMKLGVWRSSIRSTFGELDLWDQPLNLVKAWRDEGIIDIKSGTHSKNDIMINLPNGYVDVKHMFKSLEKLCDTADNL